MLPVATVHVGGVIVPGTGAAGTPGDAFIVTGDDAPETHPEEFVTVKVYVPCDRFVIVVLAPEPGEVTEPGDMVTVQLPVIGKPFSTTLPPGTAHDGCVTVPITGADGVGGWVLITTDEVGCEEQFDELLTVNV
jgi:hypothetical protein